MECGSRGAHLVTVNSQAEDEFLLPLVTHLEDGIDHWMGLTDREAEGSWQWESGEPVTYTGWAAGEPNNAGGEDSGGEDCVTWFPGGHGWNDNDCHIDFSYVCEWPKILPVLDDGG
jgi:hypothetical protein